MNIPITRTTPATVFRKDLFSLLNDLQQHPDSVIIITHDSKQAGVFLSHKLFNDLMETIDVLEDEEAMKSIRNRKKETYIPLSESSFLAKNLVSDIKGNYVYTPHRKKRSKGYKKNSTKR